MSKIRSDAPGLHQVDQDYQTSGLGKFGNRDVTLNNVQTRLKSSSKPGAFKTLFSRIADVLPGNNGKVRSYNRAQKEFSRQLGGLLGRLRTDGKDADEKQVRETLKSLHSLARKMESKIQYFSPNELLTKRLGVHFDKLTSTEIEKLQVALKNYAIDTKTEAKEYTEQLESIGLGGAFSDEKGGRVQSDLDALKDMLGVIKDAVATRNYAVKAKIPESQVPLFEQYNLKAAKWHDMEGKALPSAQDWGEINLSLPHLSKYLAANVSSDDARRIQNQGFTVDDLTSMTGPPLQLSVADAVACLSHGCDGAEVSSLIRSGLNKSDALEFARAGCTAADKQFLMTTKGYSKDEAIAFRRQGWPTDGTVELSDRRTAKVVPNSIKSASGGNVNEVFRVKYNVGGQVKDYFFAKAKTDSPDNPAFMALEPGSHRTDDPKLAQRNVASYKLDQLLKTGLVAETRYATLQAPDGTVVVGTAMAQAPGRAAQDLEMVPLPGANWVPAAKTQEDLLTRLGSLDALQKKIAGSGFEARLDPTTGQLQLRQCMLKPHDVSISNEDLRRQLVELQYMDMLAGQTDRSPGNYFIEILPNGKVKLTAIDNDMAWGTAPANGAEIQKMLDGRTLGGALQICGLPPFADQAIIDKYTKLTDQQLQNELQGTLSQAQIDAAKGRLAYIKAHLNALQPNQIVQDWGKGADHVINDRKTNDLNCYLQRDARFFKDDE